MMLNTCFGATLCVVMQHCYIRGNCITLKPQIPLDAALSIIQGDKTHTLPTTRSYMPHFLEN